MICPKCGHMGVIDYANKVHPDDISKERYRTIKIYRCTKCLHTFSLESVTKKKTAPKETPHQKEVRVLKEKLETEKERFKKHAKLQAALVKENKALKAENEQMKKEGIFPNGIPGQKKEKPAPSTRFENII